MIDRLPVSYKEWKCQAKRIMDQGPFDYIAGGAGAEDTMRANQRAFDRRCIVPRVLSDVSQRDLSVSIFGHTYPSPLFLAPIGIQGIVHPDGELASARAASSLGLPFILSTVSSRPLEEVAAAMGESPRWFQLFWGSDPDVTASLLRRAEGSGYSAIVVTVDLPTYSWREREVRNRYFPYLTGEGLANHLTDPVFRAKLRKPPEQDFEAALELFLHIFFHPGLSWKDLPILRRYTRLPILVKGILHPMDAELAIEHGADGIIVSNHGGRQLDGATAALDALPEVCDRVQGRVPVLMDSGIRHGADVLKAIGLGASAVLIGRPYIYGLAGAGQLGVHRVITNLWTDVDLSMANAGRAKISQLNRSMLHRLDGNLPHE
jgi:lactate 2-monooxygenase